MEQYVTLTDLTQIGIFLVGFTSCLYIIFRDINKRK